MADITMCANSEDCKKRATCYRATATPGDWQSYMKYYKEGEVCKNYYDREYVEEIQKLNIRINELEAQVNGTPKKWEPQRGTYVVFSNGTVSSTVIREVDSRLFGTEYQTYDQATKARDAMRTYNRLLAYVAEFGGDWEADWEDTDQSKWCVCYDYDFKEWRNIGDFHTKFLGTVYMSSDCANELVKKLNSGEVEL